MSYLDIFIPLLIGCMMLFSPQIFTQKTGLEAEPVYKKFKMLGGLMIGVAGIYTVLKIFQGTP